MRSSGCRYGRSEEGLDVELMNLVRVSSALALVRRLRSPGIEFKVVTSVGRSSLPRGTLPISPRLPLRRTKPEQPKHEKPNGYFDKTNVDTQPIPAPTATPATTPRKGVKPAHRPKLWQPCRRFQCRVVRPILLLSRISDNGDRDVRALRKAHASGRTTMIAIHFALSLLSSAMPQDINEAFGDGKLRPSPLTPRGPRLTVSNQVKIASYALVH